MGASAQDADDGSTTSSTDERDGPDDAGTDEQTDPAEASTADPEPTAQSTSLRRQQRYAATGGAVIAGMAVTVSILQRFPDLAAVAVLAGVASTVVVYRLAANSIFPGETG